MTRRLLFLASLLVLVITGSTFRWWFPTLLGFIGANSDLIQGLADLIQLVIWGSIAFLAWVKFLRPLRRAQEQAPVEIPPTPPPSPAPHPATASSTTGERSVYIKGDTTGNVISTGDYAQIHVNEPQAAAPALRKAYLNHVFENTSHLALAGIDRKAASDAEARLELAALYTALLTRSSEGELDPGQARTRPLSALEQLNRHPHLVLLGDPGSGKTTFVNFVTLCLAGTALEKEPGLATLTAPPPLDDENCRRNENEKPQPQPWDHGALLPLRVVLRDFAARGLPPAGEPAAAKHLWNFIAAELTACSLEAYAPHLHKHLHEQGGLLLLDGLDEVPAAEQRRAQIKSAVEDFARAHPRCRLLVTSRTYAYQQQAWRLDGFHDTLLAPFSRGQITRFVDGWYAYIAVLRAIHEGDPQGRAALLKRAIFASQSLLGLAERPLLLTLMASLHAWRGGTLPEKREELYADTVDLLLDWWESQRVVRRPDGEVALIQPSLAEWLNVDRKKVRSLLNRLAFEAHGRQPMLTGTADIPESALIQGLLALSPDPDLKPARLMEYLTARAGLLLPRGVGVYTFPHRTFQEYLAACHLTDHGYPEQVAALARQDPDRWREVALLAGAKATRGGAFALWPLVDALCPGPPGKTLPLDRQFAALLAGQAVLENADLENLNEPNQEKVARLRRWHVRLLASAELPAVERARAGEGLARLGDPRFDADHWHLPAEPLFGFLPVPPGAFKMGSDKEPDTLSVKDEQPLHEVTLNYAYYLNRYPVTVAQFRFFAEAADFEPGGKYSLRGLSGTPNHPVRWVSWYEALEYCRWLNEQLVEYARQLDANARAQPLWAGLASGNLQVTLPSEAEWEKAARGPDGRRYPWGHESDPEKANTIETGLGNICAVGCFPGGAGPYGHLDLSGNVSEWTRSKLRDYPYDVKDDCENMDREDHSHRVVRSGSFDSFSMNFVRCAFRAGLDPGYGSYYLGFRVVVAPTSPQG